MRLSYSFYCLVLGCVLPNFAISQSAPTIQVCGSEQEFHLTDSLIQICNRITIPAAFTEEIDSFQIDFGDGSPLRTISGDNPQLEQLYTYNFADFYNDCVRYRNQDTRVELFTYLANGNTLDNSFRLKINNPPRARFSAPAIGCTDTEICFGNNSCPAEELTSSWDFGEGLPPSDNNCYTYTDTGTYVVTLTATNPCDDDVTQRSIRIIDAPSVTAMPDSNIIIGPDNDFRVCLDGQSCIRLNGSASFGINQWMWTVNNPTGVVIDNPDRLITRVCFTTPGPRVFTLTGTNTSCNQEEEHPCPINVIEGEALLFDRQPDACPELDYTPSPSVDPNATYFIDGTEVPASSFPFLMSARGQPYLIRAEKTTDCGPLVAFDTVFVDAAVEPSLIEPANGTSFCPDTSLVEIRVSTTDGRWQPAAGLRVTDGTAFFDRSAPPGNYTFIYTLGAGDCERTLSVALAIEDSELVVPADFFICETAGPVDLSPSPDDGTLTGTGVDNTTRTFSPAGLLPGPYPITHSRNNLGTGCPETGSWIAEVVAEPTVEAGPPITLCNTDQTVLLTDFTTGFSFTPAFAEPTFAGRGIVDAVTGTYRPTDVGEGGMDTVLVSYRDPRTPGLCSATDTLFVFITGIVEPEAGNDTTLCGGSGTFFLGDPEGGTWDGECASPDGTINLECLPPGEHVFTITLGAGICASEDSRTITVVPGNGVTVATERVFLCDTAAVLSLPTVTPNEGNWDGDLPNASSVIDLTDVPAGVYGFTYTVSSLPAGCNSADFEVNILPRPEVTLRGDSVACTGAECTSFVAGGDLADAYAWTSNEGLDERGDSICYVFQQAGDYTVTLNASRNHPETGRSLCRAAPQSQTVRVLDPPEAAGIILSQDTICPQESVTLRFAPPASADLESLRYEWAYGDTSFMAVAPVELSFPSPVEDTTYLLTLTTLGTCDRAQTVVPLVVRANPVANIGVVYPEPCSGGDLILTNLGTGTLDSIEWTSSDGQRFGTFQPPVLNPVTDSFPRVVTYNLVVGNSCRTDMASIPVTIAPTDVRALPGFTDTVLCIGENLKVANLSTPGAPVDFVFNDGVTLAGDTVCRPFAEAGDYQLTVYAYGCGFDSSNWNISVLPDPTLEFRARQDLCPFQEFTYELNSDAPDALVWFGDGDSTFLNAGNYRYALADTNVTIRYQATSLEGCTADSTYNVNIAPRPEAIIRPVDSLCSNQAVSFISDSQGAQTCRWDYGDGETGDGCQSSHVYQEDDLYTVQLIATSAIGCPDTTTVPVFVRPTPRFSLGLSYDSTTCGPTPVSFEFLGRRDLASSYTLDPGDGTSPITVLNPTHRYEISGAITARLRVGFDGLCFAETDTSFYLRQFPRASTLVTDERCQPEEFLSVQVITANPEDDIQVFGPDVLTAGIDLFNLNLPGDYEFEITSPDGCDTVISYTVEPVVAIRVSTIEDTTIEFGDSIRLTTLANLADLSYGWSPPGEVLENTAMSPWVKPNVTTDFYLVATDSSCFARDTVRIVVDQPPPPVYTPTAFSPNGDGINDTYAIFPRIGVARIETFRIFDRWGELVHEQTEEFGINGSSQNWDGTFNGKPLNPAVFVYHLTFIDDAGERISIHGDFVLTR